MSDQAVTAAFDEALLEVLREVSGTLHRSLEIQNTFPGCVRDSLQVESWDVLIPALLTMTPGIVTETSGMVDVLIERYENWIEHGSPRVADSLSYGIRMVEPMADTRDVEALRAEVDELRAVIAAHQAVCPTAPRSAEAGLPQP